jgi:hypothetical protein
MHSSVWGRGAAVTSLLLVAHALRLLAQDASDTGEEVRTLSALPIAASDEIRLDGRLAEPVWRRAIPATGFLQEDPDEGEPATEETAVYVLYDSQDLYIGAMLHDSDIDGIIAHQKQRDASLDNDDRFMWILDTFLDGRTGYFFEINPAGLMGDGLLVASSFFRGGGGPSGGSGGGSGGGPGGGVGGDVTANRSWDGIWEARVARQDDGWSAEIRIPFRTLNFDPSQATWGINFQRTVRRKREETRWSGHRRNQGLMRPVHAGRLTGLRGISQGLGLEVTPYAMASWRNMPEEPDPTAFPTAVGFDLSYNVTPSLRTALTLNTDFAEVEVDQRRVNLTRFPLYFPERRDFFLEGSGVFSFSTRTSMAPFFSRRVGLAEGEPVPVTYGVRVGGQAGPYELGFFQTRTGRDNRVTEDSAYTMAPEDFTAARVKRSIFRQSTIGVVYTRRATSQIDSELVPPDAHTLGADLDLFTSSFLGDKNLQFDAFFVWNSDREIGGTSSFWDRAARGIRINYPNDTWNIQVSYREFGDDVDPAVGFVPRKGFRRLRPTISFAPRPGGISAIRQLRFGAEFEYFTDISGRLQTRRTIIRPLAINFESGDRLDLAVTQLFERLDGAFDITDDIAIPVGDYNTWEWSVSGSTAGRRVMSTNIQYVKGQFWSGNRSRFAVGLTIRPHQGISVSSEFEKDDVTLLEGDLSAHLFRLMGEWHTSPRASFAGNLQYDDVSEVLGLFAKLRWIIRPGNDFFLVFTQNWLNVGDQFPDFDLATQSAGATTKINYTHRF